MNAYPQQPLSTQHTRSLSAEAENRRGSCWMVANESVYEAVTVNARGVEVTRTVVFMVGMRRWCLRGVCMNRG